MLISTSIYRPYGFAILLVRGSAIEDAALKRPDRPRERAHADARCEQRARQQERERMINSTCSPSSSPSSPPHRPRLVLGMAAGCAPHSPLLPPHLQSPPTPPSFSPRPRTLLRRCTPIPCEAGVGRHLLPNSRSARILRGCSRHTRGPSFAPQLRTCGYGHAGSFLRLSCAHCRSRVALGADDAHRLRRWSPHTRARPSGGCARSRILRHPHAAPHPAPPLPSVCTRSCRIKC
ncbi:hypothetical protein C8F04DRAFT_1142051, partial [Mycena alexandri]